VPKIVDHAERREQLAAALWRVVVREGIEAASLRRVAAEAGWSLGSLRHYFDSQGQLLHFAMDLVVQRVTQRLVALRPQADPLATAASLLHQFLPLDADRRAEMEVWLAFASRALVDPDLREVRDETHAAVRGVCRQAVELIGTSQPELEAERVHALVDGLAQHAIVAPDVTTPARQREILAAQLRSLRQRPQELGSS
jgi:AcrR family transcriptional regulator